MVTLFSDYAAVQPEERGGYKIGHITIGDDYDKNLADAGPKNPIEGRNPWVSGGLSKKGSHPNTTFDWRLRNNKYLSLSEGDKYHDPGAHEKQARIAASKKITTVHDKPFRTPNPPKKSSGIGNYYGCFNEINKEDECRGIRHETEYDVIKKGELPAKKDPNPGNILCAPMKKGTYGCVGTLLSNCAQAKGSEMEPWTGLDYICDPYDRERQIDRERKLKEKEKLEKLAATGPWRSQTRIKGMTFDVYEAKSTGCSQVYKLTKPLPPKKVLKLSESKPVADVPFKPPHQGRSGLAGFFGEKSVSGERQAFPEYREDPYEMKEQKERDERKKNEPAYGPWKPVSHGKQLCTKSIEFGRGF